MTDHTNNSNRLQTATGKRMTVRKFLSVIALIVISLPLPAQFSKPRRQYVEYLVTASRADRNYRTGEQATLTVEAYKGGNALDGVKVYYRAGDEMFLPQAEDSVTFVNGRAEIPVGTRTEPGFRACSLRFTVYGKQAIQRPGEGGVQSRGNQASHGYARRL